MRPIARNGRLHGVQTRLLMWSHLPSIRCALVKQCGSDRAVDEAIRDLIDGVLEVPQVRHARRFNSQLRRARRALIQRLRQAGVSLPHGGIQRVGEISEAQAACLWLAWCPRAHIPQHVKSISGLWGAWETCLSASNPVQLPDFVRYIFAPPSKVGGEQVYLGGAFILLVAHAHRRVQDLSTLSGIEINEAHQLLAGVIRNNIDAPSDEPLPPKERDLFDWLAETLGVEIAGTTQQSLGAIGARVNELAREYNLAESDANRMLTWIVGTCVETRPADDVLDDVRERSNRVEVELLRGRRALRTRIIAQLVASIP